MTVTFITGNLKGCRTKELILLKCLIIALFQTYGYYGTKKEQNLMEAVLNKLKLHLIMEK